MRIANAEHQKTPLNLFVDSATRKKLAKLASKNRRSASQEVSTLVEEAWEHQKAHKQQMAA